MTQEEIKQVVDNYNEAAKALYDITCDPKTFENVFGINCYVYETHSIMIYTDGHSEIPTADYLPFVNGSPESKG